ncbi:MAG TPA: hypothetical protein VHE37_12085 [Nevskiaceae bacterium]|nr:hypothetical protein [Nevskiaceae bacterium]
MTPQPRLALLASHQGEACALILQSLQTTHADVLRFDDISRAETRDGVATVVGDFTHLPSMRRYVIAIAAVPLD